MATEKVQQGPADGQEGAYDAHLKERLVKMAAARSPFVNNGRFLFYSELNALTYWYEDHMHSTHMVSIVAEA